MEHNCKFCGRTFKSGIALGGHIVSCKKNPNNRMITGTFKEKIQESLSRRNPKSTYTLICEFCGKEYTLTMRKSQYDSGKYRRTCSSTCATKLSEKHTDKKIKNEKISKKLKENPKCPSNLGLMRKDGKWVKNPNWSPIKICPVCGKEYSYKQKTRYCSDECKKIGRHNKLSESAKKHNLGGYVPNSIKKHHHGQYLGIHCDSSWELAYLVYNIEHNINIKRCDIQRKYINSKGKLRNYFPDFIVEGKIIEIKGYEDRNAKLKSLQNPDILVLKKNDIMHCIKYVEEKYGKRFWEILYENT